MTSLALPTLGEDRMAQVHAAGAMPCADAPVSVCIDVRDAAPGPQAEEFAVGAASCGLSDISSCDLNFDMASVVAPSDSASVTTPAYGPSDDAYTAWKLDCERKEAEAREQAHNASPDSVAMQKATEAAMHNMGFHQMMQCISQCERSLANLHMHFGTGFAPDRSPGLRRQAHAQAAGGTPEMPQTFHCNNNINAPNMNRQHATGGRGRGRRHAHLS